MIKYCYLTEDEAISVNDDMGLGIDWYSSMEECIEEAKQEAIDNTETYQVYSVEFTVLGTAYPPQEGIYEPIKQKKGK